MGFVICVAGVMILGAGLLGGEVLHIVVGLVTLCIGTGDVLGRSEDDRG